jgi:putative membrane protein
MSDRENIRRYIGWGVLGLIIVIGAATVASLAFRGPGGFHFFPFWGIGGIFLVFAVFWVARWLFWPWRGWGYRTYYQGDGAKNILQERYARGEITKEQFDQMMQDLQKGQ